jgi:hypothetical protein
MTETLIETVGWIGAALILAAYILLSSGRLGAQSRPYQWMNVIGAIGLVINSGWNGAIPSAVLNTIWMAMGVVTLWKIGQARVTTTPV